MATVNLLTVYVHRGKKYHGNSLVATVDLQHSVCVCVLFKYVFTTNVILYKYTHAHTHAHTCVHTHTHTHTPHIECTVYVFYLTVDLIMFFILPCSSAVPSASSTLFRPLDTLMEYDGRFAILNSLITICVHTTISGPVLSLGRGGGYCL